MKGRQISGKWSCHCFNDLEVFRKCSLVLSVNKTSGLVCQIATSFSNVFFQRLFPSFNVFFPNFNVFYTPTYLFFTPTAFELRCYFRAFKMNSELANFAFFPLLTENSFDESVTVITPCRHFEIVVFKIVSWHV